MGNQESSGSEPSTDDCKGWKYATGFGWGFSACVSSSCCCLLIIFALYFFASSAI